MEKKSAIRADLFVSSMKRTLIVFFLFIGGVLAQNSPKWFFKPDSLNISTYCGIIETGYYKDSSFKTAFNKACKKAAIYSGLKIKLSQSFLSAIDKKYWTEFSKEIQYDTSLVSYFQNNYSVIDSFQTNKFTIVLISQSKTNSFAKDTLKAINNFQVPEWIKSLPKSGQYFYAIGQSMQYYHEVSSWDAAENSAVAELARNKFLKISSELIKEKSRYADSIVDLQTEEVETILDKIEIVERWIDRRNKIFYVLARAPIN